MCFSLKFIHDKAGYFVLGIIERFFCNNSTLRISLYSVHQDLKGFFYLLLQ